MGVDIATLGLEVRSDGVVVASSRLKELTQSGAAAEKSTTALASSFGNLDKYIKMAVAALSVWQLAQYIKDATLLAARVETLGVVMKVVGNNAGYTGKQMDEYTAQLKKMGITTQESMSSLIKMAGAQMDLTKASQLARVAQDAAVIGGINSSEAFGRMINGIRSGEVEILKTMGINVQFEQSYKKMAETLGKTSEQLTNQEKTAARMQAVLEYGVNIAGAYEASMGTAGKQMLSMARYTEELKLKLGEAFTPALTFIIGEITHSLKGMDDSLKSNQDSIGKVGQGLRLAFVSVAAEIQRVMMLVDLAGGTLTAFGSRAMKVAEVVTRFMTIGQMGDWFKEKSEDLAKGNALYAQRYAEGEKELQRLADGLEASGGAGRTAAQEKAALEAAAAQKKKQAAEDAAAAARAAAKSVEEWRKTYADLRTSIAELNPTMTEQEKKIADVTNKYDDLMHKKGANIALLKQLREEHMKAIADHYAVADAIKATSNEFKEYLRLAEEETPQHGASGEMNIRWAEELKQLQALQPGAGFTAMNEQIDQFNKLLQDIPDKAEAVRAAIEKLKADFAQSSGLTDLLAQNTELETSMITDPYAKQKRMMEDRYKLETDLIKKTMAANKNSIELQEAGKKTLHLKEQQYIKATADLDDQSLKARLGMAGQYTGMAGQMFQQLAQTQDQTSKEGFESAKAFSIAAAVMNTAAAIMNAMATVPYPMSIAAAALAAATGAIQIATISSTSFGGGAGSITAPSGSFGAGGATGSGAGGSISAPYQSTRDSQSAEQLDVIANSMDNAALAMGRAADSFLDISEMFKTGVMSMLMNIVPGRFTEMNADKAGLLKNAWNSFAFKDMTQGLISILKFDAGGLTNAFTAGLKTIGNALFGGDKQVSGGGITGSLQDGQFNVGSFTKYHKNGGIFGASWDQTVYGNDVDPAFRKGMTDFFSGLKNDIMRGAGAFGISAVSTQAGFANAQDMKFQVETAGKKPEDIQKEWEEKIQAASDALVKTIPGLKDFALGGELATDTLARLSSAVLNTNDNLGLINARLIPTSGSVNDLAYNLELLMGGAAKFKDKIEGYVASMFTENEQAAMKAAQAQRAVNRAFLEMNIAAPASKEEFVRLVQGLDTTSESGARTFASLMDVAESFATVQDQIKRLKEATDSFNNDLTARTLELDGINADLFELRIKQQEEMTKAIEDGMDTGALQIVQNREWAKAVDEAMGVVSTSIQDTIALAKSAVLDMLDAQIAIANTMKTIMTGPLAMLSPEAAYNQALSKFSSLVGKTDIESLKAMPEAATALLNASKSYNASGAAYQNDLATVLNAMNAMIGGNGDPTLATIDLQLQELKAIKKAIEDLNYAQLRGLTDLLGTSSPIVALLGAYNAQTATTLQTTKEQAAAQTYIKLNTAIADVTANRDEVAHLEGVIGQQYQEKQLNTSLLSNAAYFVDKYTTQYNTIKNDPTWSDASKSSLLSTIQTWTNEYNRIQSLIDYNNTTITTSQTQIDALNTNLPALVRSMDFLAATLQDIVDSYDTANITPGAITGVPTLPAGVGSASQAGRYTQLDSYFDGTDTYIVWRNDSTGVIRELLEGQMPSFAKGTAYLQSDGPIYAHQGEIVVDPQSSDILRRYGIQVNGAADSETVAELKALLVESRAQTRVLQAGLTELINTGKQQVRNSESLANTARLAVNA